MIGKFIVNRCANDATIAGLIGARIFPIAAPQDTATPYITYQVSDAPADTNKITGETKYNYSVTLTIYERLGKTVDAYERLEAVKDALRQEFNYNDSTAAGVIVEGSHYEGSDDGLVPETDFFYKQVRLMFRVRYT